MPFHTAHPVLLVEESRLRNIDPQDPESLFGMWSAFHKCAGVLENGRRLENLSWRVFAHETMFVSKKRQAQPRHYFAGQTRPNSHLPPHPPELSSSVDSHSSVETGRDDGDDGLRSPFDTRGSICNSLERSRTRDKHITPIDLQNLVISIKVKQALDGPLSPLPLLHPHTEAALATERTQRYMPPLPEKSESMRTASLSQQGSSVQESLPTPRPSSPRPVESSTSTIATRNLSPDFTSPSSNSATSAESDSAHPVVRGFKTGLRGASSYRSQSQLHLAPHPHSHSCSEASEPEHENVLPRKKGGMFTLGGSLTEDEASVRDNVSPQLNNSTAAGNSSLKSSHKPQHQKHASFLEKVTEIPKKRFLLSTSAEEGNAIESDDDDEYNSEEEVSESAIEEDDDEWEDEAESEENSRQLTFPRVESRANLVSHRSVITEGLHETQRATGMQNAASRSTPLLRRSRTSTPNGPSMPASPDESTVQLGSPGASSRPIMLPAYNMATAQIPLSPRATRRNMLTQELGVSLRKHMLNERQTRNGPYGAAAALQRRHTSHNVPQLTQYPSGGPSNAPTNTSSRTNSLTEYYDAGAGDYHQTGW